MTAKQKKLFLLTSMMSVFVMAVAVLFAGGNVISPLERVFASQEEVVDGTINFNKADTVRNGSTNTTIGYTTYNHTVICKVTDNDTTYSEGVIGAVKTGSQIHFYEADGVTEFFMENLNKLIVTYSCPTSSTYKSPSFHLYGLYSDGRDVDIPYATSDKNATRTANFASAGYGAVSELYVDYTYATTFCIESIQIVYDCNPKVQTGVEASTPTKTSYMVGQSFDPSGMMVKAVYSNGTKVATDRFTYYPTGPLTLDDEFITVSFGGHSTNVAIVVTDAASHAVGSYYNGTYSTHIVLNNDGTGTNYTDSDSCSFTWSFNGTTLSFTSSQTYSFTGSMFSSSTSVNANTLTYDVNNDISSFKVPIKTMWGTSSPVFSRQ